MPYTYSTNCTHNVIMDQCVLKYKKLGLLQYSSYKNPVINIKQMPNETAVLMLLCQ